MGEEPTNIPIDLTHSIDLNPSTDQTIYWSMNPAPDQKSDPARDQISKWFPQETKAEDRVFHKDETIEVKAKGRVEPSEGVEVKDDEIQSSARACVCRAYKDRYLSASLRLDREIGGTSKKTNNPQWLCASWSNRTTVDGRKVGKFLIESAELIEALWRMLLPTPSQTPLTGLVVFSGSTMSGKSNVARAFALRSILAALHSRKKTDRLPHLVTFEDPIEPWTPTTFLTPPDESQKGAGKTDKLDSDPSKARGLDFCFTPRELDKDTKSLEQSLIDAKRQTPTCFFVGELRLEKDWKAALEFAGSGHLVVTTTHAARLNETVSRIIAAMHATTPADRRSVGGFLTACVHLQKVTVGKQGLLLPAVWARQGAALTSLVADGLSSITPNGSYVYSRRQFLDKVVSTLNHDSSESSHPCGSLIKADKDRWADDNPALADARQQALTMDINELLQQ